MSEIESLQQREHALEAEIARLRAALRRHAGADAEATGPSDAGKERYRLAVRATKDAIWDWDLLANTVQWNEALQDAYGHAPETVEPTGEWWISQIHPEDRTGVHCSIHSVIAGHGSNWSGEYRFRRADGSYASVLDRGFVIRDREGRGVRMIGAMFDLSERKDAEEALRRSEDRLRLATNAARIGIFDYRVQEDELSWDARCSELFGLPPGQRVSYHGTFLPGLHPADRAAIDAEVRRALDPAGNGTFAVEYRTIGLRDRVERWVAASGEALFEKGAAIRLVGTVMDISEHKRTEARLRELNDTLERRVADRTRERDRLWATSHDLLGVADETGVWISINPAWTDALGWHAEEILGRTSEWLEHPEDRHRTREELAQLVRAGRSTNFENRLRTRDGAYRYLSWAAVPAEGLLYCSARDVTEQKAAADRLARTEDALRQSQKMEAVGQLTGGLAHDFNNLLTGISGSLELLASRVAQGRLKDIERYINAAQGAARRAASLTHRLLAFSRRQTLDPRPTDANRLIAGMEELVRRTAGPSIAVEVVESAGLWTILVDPPQLENALLNLCINARDAMPKGGRLCIETANTFLDERAAQERDLPPGQYVALSVTDTGTGMVPEVKARAFDPFFTTKPIGQGTGLGLSMIYGFVRQSGGQVRAYTEPGQGTTMCLYLPRHHGKAEQQEELPPLFEASPPLLGETVLVVDDEPTVRMLVAEVLEDLGYMTLEATDAAGGLKVLQSDSRVDLLVTDIGLPGETNGRQLADAARTLRPGLKVLIITGYAENAVLGSGQLEPGMHLLTKPFAMETLARRIQGLIGGP
jgi:PAS domain S-box-containing protein